MKKVLKRSLSFLLAIALIFSSAYVGLSEVDFGGLFAVKAKAVEYIHPLVFELSSDGTYYSVSADPNCFFEGENVSTALVIPDTYNGLPVTQIGNDSLLLNKGFKGCEFTSVVIPDSVTCIGIRAFMDCKYLQSVTIGSGVTAINWSAFQGCTSLNSIKLPDSLTNIGLSAFANCINLTSIAIPENVTSIESYAFEGCKKFESLNIPDGVTKIGGNAFEGCINLRSIKLSKGLTTIDKETFKGCTHLQLIDIPSAVTTIGVNAFLDCTSLITVTIPDSVNSIGDKAFYNCTSLTSIIIPDSVTSIGEAVLDGCTNFEYIFFTGTQEQWENIEIDTNNTGVNFSSVHYEAIDHTFELVTDRTATCTEKGIAYEKCIVCGLIKNTVETPAQGHNYSTVWTTDVVATCKTPGSKSRHCTRCDAKTDVTEIPTTDHSYSNYTFDYTNNTKTRSCYRCEEVFTEKIAIDDIVRFTLSGDGTYYSITDCSESASGHIEIPAYYNGLPVKKISAGSFVGMGFMNCNKITSITIPSTITEISADVFLSCDNIKAVYISDMDAWRNITFGNLNSNPMRNGADLYIDGVKLTCPVIPSGTTKIPDYAFYGCTSIISVVIPESVTSIGNSAFGKCANLSTINLPEGLIEIGSSAFSGCTNLSSIILPDGLTKIGSAAFSGCTNLASINIPNNVTVISNSVFGNCSKLTNVVIPDNVESIGDNAFSRCISLTSVVVNGNGETTIGESAFDRCDNLSSVTLNGVKSIGNEAFDCCEALVGVNFGDCLTHIGEQAFVGCESLQNISIPSSITRIEREVFADCRKLTTVTLPDTLTYIGEGAFVSCVKLSKINIPDSVEIIDEAAFLECGSLTSIEIPDSVTSLGMGALAMCRKLKTIKLPKNITTLPEMLFYECSSLESIAISNEITSIGTDCFFGCIDFMYIFYEGSEAQWTEIEKLDESEYLEEVIVHYNSTGHTYEWRTTQEATCTSHGIKVDECTCCGLQRETLVVSALGHNYSGWVVDSKFTCETDGSRYRTCLSCGDVETIKEIATGHEFLEEWTIDVAAQCLTNGEKSHHCKNCSVRKDITIIEALGHDYDNRWTIDVEPSCTEDGEKSHKCLICHDRKDITIITATGHSYGDWIVETEATCFETGLKYQECENCNEKVHEEIPAGNHMYSGWKVVTKATCDTDGLKVRVCNICDIEESAVVSSFGHNYSESWTVDVVPTCTEAGVKSHHCINCESTKDATQIASTGHSFGVWIFDIEATCEIDGSRHRLCENCGDKEIQDIVALGHQYSTLWTIDVEPTCSATGTKSHHCFRCDGRTDIEEIPYGGHIFGKWYVVTQPTMDEAGVRAHKCYNCEMTEAAELPKLLKYTATFVADGDVVATVDFPEDATEIEIPDVPHKDKFNGEWENFTVRNKNFTVNAVYTPISTEQIDGITAGNTADYYSSTGEVEINLNVSAPSKTIVTTTTKAVPLDIIFVLDQSGSMADGGKKNALKNAVASFSNEILADAIANSVDHRIAVVGFASGNNDNLNYGNTELLTSKTVKYNKITDADYKDALVSVNNEGALNSVISSAINNIDAEGATKADLGLEMASNIFANNPVENGRQRVVVFLTDGVPTSYSSFEYSVANVAIQNAYQLKNTYGATVYSVGVFDRSTSADRSVNNFMNYVSSNYNEEVVMKKNSKETTENINGYYLDVSDVSTLSDVFTSIVEETTTHTGRFSNATLKYTLTKYFTLTSVQEDAIRKSAIEALGVTNEQITITRNADSTTTIVITGVEPWAECEQFVIDFTFRATANGNTLKSGTYQVGTFESGVILENGEGYEAVFAPNSVDMAGTSGIAVFNINGIPYAINRLSSTTKVVAPATSFGADYNFIGWSIPANLTLNNEVRVFEAELLKNEYKISWNIDGEIIEEIYAVGDFINIPQVGNNSIGGAFVGWDRVIPEKMPSENLTITAIYDAHYHKYDVTKDFELCTDGGTLTYTCDCGDTYTEEIAPCEHSWEVITASNNHNAIENAGSRCTVCGIKDSKALRLEATATYQMSDASYNTATVELDYVDENGDKHQPEGGIEISVQLDEVFENDIPENANASVYRVNDDGSRTLLPSEQNGMNMTFVTDHFSTYEFEFTTGEQKYLFAQNGSVIDYEHNLVFTEVFGAKHFKSIVTYLAPASLVSNVNQYGYFGTGTSIDLSRNNVTDSYKVIVKGDLNGDGVCDVLDASYAALVSSGHKTATQDEIYAANGEIADEIDVYDYQAIVNRAVS